MAVAMQQRCFSWYKNKKVKEIIAYAHIKNNQVSVNGQQVFTSSGVSVSQFLTDAYKFLNISYPKFHKMDTLCKLGFLGTEYALMNTGFLDNDRSKMAIVLSNAASSLETDRQHQHSIADKNNYFPSPAVFVYTLPNIVIGEIAIRHKITGENAFFVSGKFDASLIVNYLNALFLNSTETAIGGWVQVDGNTYEAFIFLVQNPDNTNKNSIFKPLNELNVTHLYNQ